MILVAVYFRILEAMTRIKGTMAIMGAIMVVVMMAVVGVWGFWRSWRALICGRDARVGSRPRDQAECLARGLQLACSASSIAAGILPSTPIPER